jgi:hypothetical protein
MKKKLNERELAEPLSAILDRAHDGERFVIERYGEKLAIFSPPESE